MDAESRTSGFCVLPSADNNRDTAPSSELLTLTLKPQKQRKKKAVQWASDVVDNEHLQKKSSKKCCIFHKRHVFGEWMDSDTDEDDEQSHHHHPHHHHHSPENEPDKDKHHDGRRSDACKDDDLAS